MEADTTDLIKYLPSLLFVIAMIVLFWLVVIRPTNQSQKKHKELIETIVPGDRVVTVGGIYGKIVRVGENTFDLEVAEDLVLTFDRRAVRKRQGEND
ncbi:MAG: preprotein translocase subunit YajC [Armatimonadetes bacterium]|nr:preprotein translocase subunit YajC [Armatimonadota bacterium]